MSSHERLERAYFAAAGTKNNLGHIAAVIDLLGLDIATASHPLDVTKVDQWVCTMEWLSGYVKGEQERLSLALQHDPVAVER